MTTKPIGLYVHTPLCVRKCNYCDFCSYPVSESAWREEYINTLCKEIDSYKDRGLSVDTVFFGGGTPSLLSSFEFDKICRHINSAFGLSADAEFSIEANPKTLTKENLSAYISCGVNRISMGVQSIHENELKILGRIHGFADVSESVELIRSCGIGNLNLDLMYGIPEQTIESFSETIDTIFEFSPEHLSLYGLILEEGTPFWEKRNKLRIPEEDVECDMYFMALNKLYKRGYRHYEISNYSKEGHECRHNLKYWQNEEFVGVGVSAYSYLDGMRYGNSSDVSEYLSENGETYKYSEEIDTEALAYEYVMLRLRLRDGFSLTDYKTKFGKDFITADRRSRLDELVSFGYVELAGDRIKLSDKGFYISNRILTELL